MVCVPIDVIRKQTVSEVDYKFNDRWLSEGRYGIQLHS